MGDTLEVSSCDTGALASSVSGGMVPECKRPKCAKLELRSDLEVLFCVAGELLLSDFGARWHRPDTCAVGARRRPESCVLVAGSG